MKKVRCDMTKPACGHCGKSAAKCMYRGDNRSAEADSITELAGLDVQNRAPTWSSSNWLAKADGTLKWPVFRDQYKMPQSNTLIASRSEEGFPELGPFSSAELQSMGLELKDNITAHITSYLENVANKSPIVDAKSLYRTAEFIKTAVDLDPTVNIFEMDLPKDTASPLPLFMSICACGAMAKTLTLTNLVTFGNSLNEKQGFFEYAYRLFVLGAFLNTIPKYKIPDFDLNMVQFHMAQAHFWMYNLKPLKTWNSIFKASTLVMAIVESYKASGRKFTEEQHVILERVFHCCVKYESELRVELSPNVPSSGIVNYPFPSIYPTPPLDGSMNPNDEATWFFFLTEITLRKFENRLMDDLYVPISISSDDSASSGEYKGDNYILDWSRYTISEMLRKCQAYAEDLHKIERSMISSLSQIIPDNDDLRPYGFVLQKVSDQEATTRHQQQLQQKHQMQQQQQLQTDNPVRLGSPASSNDSTDLSVFLQKRCGKIPEVVQFIRTRLIAVRLTLFRPLFYLILHDAVPDYENPFIKELIHQGVESMDLLNVPLATHRHFGSWFYCKTVFTSAMTVWGFYLRFQFKFFDKERLDRFLRDVITIFDYWCEECTELKENRRILNQMLNELQDA